MTTGSIKTFCVILCLLIVLQKLSAQSVKDDTVNILRVHHATAVADTFCKRAENEVKKGFYLAAISNYLHAVKALETGPGKEGQLLKYQWRILNNTLSLLDTLTEKFSNIDYNILIARFFFPLYEKNIHISAELYQKTGNEQYYWHSLILSEKLRVFMFKESIKNRLIENFLSGNSMIADVFRELSATMIMLRNNIDHAAQRKDEKTYNELNIKLEKLTYTYDSLYFFTGCRAEKIIASAIRSKYIPNHQYKVISDDQTAFIEYFYGDSSIYCWVLTKKQKLLFEIEAPLFVDSLCRVMIKSINERSEQHSKTSTLIYGLLFEKTAPLLKNISNLIIIPDGPLFMLPWECLSFSGSQTSGQHDMSTSYLLHHYKISVYPSLTAYYNAFQKGLLAGNPEITFFAPAFGKRAQAEKHYATPSDNEAVMLSELRFSGKLCRDLHQWYQVNEFLDHAAVKASFLNELGQSSIIHLATHTVFNDSDPFSTAVYFDSGNDSVMEYQKLLLSEIYSLKTRCRLITLASCETGKGSFARGSGFAGISQAFSYAGCDNLIYTLWPVDEKASNTILLHFYHQLAQGIEATTALQQAKITFLEHCSPAEKHPYFWAGIVYSGVPLNIQTETKLPLFAIYFSGFLALFTFFLSLFIIFSTKNRNFIT